MSTDFIENRRLPTLGSSWHMLVEFHPNVHYDALRRAALSIGNLGYSMVLAHAERYRCLRIEGRAARLQDSIYTATSKLYIVGSSGTTVNIADIQPGKLPQLKFASSEAMNTLATNLSYCGDHIKTVLMTSRYAYEGKSYVTMNLMRTLASLQKKVVLLDTDLRCSRLVSNYQMRFPDDHNRGLAHYLAGMCELDDIIYETNVENAYVVPIGREINNSLQLLSST